jgi:hypothetical protein
MNWSDLDISIGWQTPGNYPNWKCWRFSLVRNEGQGEVTTKTIRVYMITFLGMYARVHLMGPKGFAELRGDME